MGCSSYGGGCEVEVEVKVWSDAFFSRSLSILISRSGYEEVASELQVIGQVSATHESDLTRAGRRSKTLSPTSSIEDRQTTQCLLPGKSFS